MANEKKYMEVIDEDDNITKYEILLSFILVETNKRYIIYTDNTYNGNRELNVYASIYNPLNNTKLEKIESQEEWEIIKKQIKKIKLKNR